MVLVTVIITAMAVVLVNVMVDEDQINGNIVLPCPCFICTALKARALADHYISIVKDDMEIEKKSDQLASSPKPILKWKFSTLKCLSMGRCKSMSPSKRRLFLFPPFFLTDKRFGMYLTTVVIVCNSNALRNIPRQLNSLMLPGLYVIVCLCLYRCLSLSSSLYL